MSDGGATATRGDLLWPIMPAGALIAGIELTRLTRGIEAAKLNAAIWVVVLLALAGVAPLGVGRLVRIGRNRVRWPRIQWMPRLVVPACSTLPFNPAESLHISHFFTLTIRPRATKLDP